MHVEPVLLQQQLPGIGVLSYGMSGYVLFVHELLPTSEFLFVVGAVLPFEIMIESCERSTLVIEQADDEFPPQHLLGYFQVVHVDGSRHGLGQYSNQPIILDQLAPGIIVHRHILQRRISRALQKVKHAGRPVHGVSKYDERPGSIVRVEQAGYEVDVGGDEGVGEVGRDEAEVEGAGNALGGGDVHVRVVVLAEAGL